MEKNKNSYQLLIMADGTIMKVERDGDETTAVTDLRTGKEIYSKPEE